MPEGPGHLTLGKLSVVDMENRENKNGTERKKPMEVMKKKLITGERCLKVAVEGGREMKRMGLLVRLKEGNNYEEMQKKVKYWT